jgi:hypothetical protein
MDLATVETTQVTRPLRVLVPLIKDDLEHARDASERAAKPYYQSAGEKMLEAKGQLNHGEFTPWLKRNFNISVRAAQLYMNFANATINAKRRNLIPPANLRDAVHQSSNNPNFGKRAAWHSPVKEAIGRVNVEALAQGAKAQQEERALQRKLSLSLIDIGYKALASKLHPDKGGSAAAMTRLNRVREILKKAVTA